MVIVARVAVYRGDHIIKLPAGQPPIGLRHDTLIRLHTHLDAPFYREFIGKLFSYKLYIIVIGRNIHLEIHRWCIGKIHVEMVRKTDLFHAALNGRHGLHDVRYLSIPRMGGMQMIIIHIVHEHASPSPKPQVLPYYYSTQ